jgi:ribosomal protein S4
MRLDSFVLFLGFSPNRIMAKEFVRFGGLRVNDLVVTNYNYSMHVNDIFQLSMAARNYLSDLYGTKINKLNMEHKVKFVQFLQTN